MEELRYKLRKHIRKKILNIDSRFRKSTTETCSDFNIELVDSIKNVLSIRLASVELPNAFYAFSAAKKNTSFNIVLASGIHTITITDGNYDSTTLIEAIQTELDTLNTATGECFEIELSETSGKVTIKNGTTDSDFSLYFDNYDSVRDFDFGLGYNLGFRKTTYEDLKTYTTESIIDVVGEQYVFLQLEDFGHVESFRKHDYLLKRILAKIILRNEKFTVIFDDGSNFLTKTVLFDQPRDISYLNVKLIDAYGLTLAMLDMNFSFTLEIEYIEERTG